MNKSKQKLIDKTDTIKLSPSFNDIKNRINYNKALNIDVSTTNKRKKLVISFSTISLVLTCLVITLVIVFNSDIYLNNKLSKDIAATNIKLESFSDSTKVDDQNIYIKYPMMRIGCNLEEELEFTFNSWQVYKDGKIIDKNNVDLTYGINEYEIVLYKLDEVEIDYNLKIRVGE